MQIGGLDPRTVNEPKMDRGTDAPKEELRKIGALD